MPTRRSSRRWFAGRRSRRVSSVVGNPLPSPPPRGREQLDPHPSPPPRGREPALQALLEVNGVEVIYNHVILVLKGVSLTVPEGGIVALLGGNGAGKTTTLKAVSNLLKSERGEVTKGSIHFRGERVDALEPADLVKRGVIQVMEGRHCFGHLTVEENLLTGAYTRKISRSETRAELEKVYAFFPRLKQRRTSMAGFTSGGEQQMTAIGRALMG